VPLPSVPTLKVGTDQLFTALDQTTAPRYLLSRQRSYCGGGDDSSGFGCGADSFSASSGGGNGYSSDLGVAPSYDMGAASSVAVQQASLGPYDYAVLKADDETAMLQWLADNRYFVPAGTMDAVKPYIHPGGYFLALKLRGGQSAGDIVPVVLRYTSDLPMIPITLTQVGAVENMGVLVWIAGEARAIPRNYYHVVLDDLPVWFSNFANYNLQLIDAVHEAPGKHGFVTLYAGSSRVMSQQLDYPGRFGDADTLRLQSTPSAYLQYLRQHGFAFDGTLLSILSRYIPEPQALVDRGVSLGQFYAAYDAYAGESGGDPDGGAGPAFAAGALTDEIVERVVTPTQDAQALLDRHVYLTRLYTALSPKDMTLDPVFSFNRDLPDVPLLHTATLTTPCTGEPWLATGDGFEAQYISGFPPSTRLPASLRVEKLLDAGPPQTVQDNTDAIVAALGPVDHGSTQPKDHHDGGGCAVGAKRLHTNVALLLLAAFALLVVRRRRAR
jgi:hypothetical protein